MEFRIGDKVWESGRGNGTVTSVWEEPDTYPIEVDFGDSDEYYTSDGKRYYDNPERCLYHGWDLKVVGEIIPVECWLIKYASGTVSGTVFASKEDAELFNCNVCGTTYHKVII